ncbi:uncharacterized protein si:dkey-92i15.4 [Brienomyrus brachyistius]|uniref:uncharacterized protein si:dkey-92i15.4 n=1 Tax=Brienomyrus brachyistius TaxID=42636 RepID=UPI0020B3DF0E|nr:uncharacterized protein si:dkey-92i15.4 [Brienomyrus brachyistius]XP_048880487.1 uncharacterized protein si:dkey-92i15.4 [Brienomyrus brachyistius]XP_048880488.1 uncharacterized protein si:dkey-92i15.4 [Brienomyrus brachyistius]XP_048880489.1 uncharacterized protein si:dkey-92i15.4 [Brienomyrus brachyistius]XP_048880490.1 uncharacterized protein si:dkey-92i15.4 [Brienomyrus brachyistius]XP_048880491.1 uncharacterized protein si:dkey-92i15.4 [Brienomyrus brachyistius]XP_048880492.1 uncharac
MELSEDPLPKCSALPGALSKPGSADIKAECKAPGLESTTNTLPPAVPQGHNRRFIIRSATELAPSKEKNRPQRDLGRLRSVYEGNVNNLLPEESGSKQTDRQPGNDIRRLSTTITGDDTEDQTRTSSDLESNQLKAQNWEKYTKDLKDKVRLNTQGSQEVGKPERCYGEDYMKPGMLRGRAEPSRSRSVDLGGESSNNEGKAGEQTFWKNNNMRRAESLDRERPSNTKDLGVLPRTDSYQSVVKTEGKKPLGGSPVTGSTHGLLYSKMGNDCQSLPSRRKLNRSDSGEGRNLGDPSQDGPYLSKLQFNPVSGPVDSETNSRKVEEVSANQSIRNRIEKLFGSSSMGMATKYHQEPLGDYTQHTKQGLEDHNNLRPSLSNTHWKGIPYKGPKGGTFPRIHSVEEQLASGHGNLCTDKKSVCNLNQEMPSVCSAAGDQMSLTEITGSDCKHQSSSFDRPQKNPSDLIQPRLFRPHPGNMLLSGKNPPLQRQTRLVTDKGERWREFEMEKDRMQEEHEIGRSNKKKEVDVMRDQVHNADQQKVAEGNSAGKLVKESGEDNNTQSKSPRVGSVVQRSPTVKTCTTTDWPLQPSQQSASQEAVSAPRRLTKEAKKDTLDNPCGKIKDQKVKPDPVKFRVDFPDSVRNKIRRFETLAQNSQPSPLPLSRSERAFSVQDPPRELWGGWAKKGVPNKVLAGKGDCGLQVFNDNLWSKGEGKSNIEVDGRPSGYVIRSISIDEAGHRRCDRRMVCRNKCDGSKAGAGLHGASVEPHSSKVSHTDTKGEVKSQEEISQHLNAKQLNALQKTDGNNKNDISGQNVYDSMNASSVECKAPNFPKRSPLIHVSNITSSCPNQVCISKMESPASVNILKNIRSTPSPSPPNLPTSVPTPPASKPQSSNIISSNDFLLHTGKTPLEKDSACSSVHQARWSSDEEESDKDDDSGTEKEENSVYDSDSAESSVTITSNMSQTDHRSFSITLADLCHVGGVDYVYHDDGSLEPDSLDYTSHRTASLSSDASALSCVSILSADELDRLLSDVRSLGDETLQNYEDVQVVVLHKEVGSGLGFTLAGGVDQNKPITVHKVFSGSAASQEGSVCEGDRVLSINGTKLQNSTHWEALRTLRRARSRGMAVVVLQKDSFTKPQKAQNNLSQRQLDPVTVNTGGRTLTVVLNKSSTDLGFSLEGGLGSSQGDGPIVIKKVFQGGPVNEVLPGDELLEINGHSLLGLHRLEAWNLIKKLSPGPVEVLLNRPL